MSEITLQKRSKLREVVKEREIMFKVNVLVPLMKCLIQSSRPFKEETALLDCAQISTILGFHRNRCINAKSAPPAACVTATSKDEARDFMAVFPDVVRDLTESGRHLDIPEATKWFAKVLQYNVPNGKKNRGLAVPFSYKILMNKPHLSENELYLTHLMGWCVELFQGHILLLDDIMDQSLTRRGRPCWYRTNNLGVKAINDGLLLESAIYQILRKHFRDKPYYVDAMELFHDVTLKTVMGQALDLNSSTSNDKPDLSKFTMARYNSIVKYKTSYYSFHLPVALAMSMAGINDEELRRQAKMVLLEMGHFFQVQDDFMDCFGDPEVTGKVGTDIEDGKCSWLAIVALQRFNCQQRAVMEECYGVRDPEKVQKIKDLYEEVGILATYSTYEEESYNLITTHIRQISSGLPQELFFTFLRKIYRRSC